MSTELKIRELCLGSFDEMGFAPATRSPFFDYYRQWVQNGYHAEMNYLSRHIPQKENPQTLLANAQSWIVVLRYYDTEHPLSLECRDDFLKQEKGWIARYAHGEDYHIHIKKDLDLLVSQLSPLFPSEKFKTFVDTSPVLERDIAARAGLGWIGKNTCLINKKLGSFVFIGELLTTLELQSSRAVLDHCGTCTRCLDACPTQAFSAPQLLDANRCISYWTIESKKEAPPELARKFGSHLFGCDICQDVCPWNKKTRRAGIPKNQPLRPFDETLFDLRHLANMPSDQLKNKISNTALSRCKPEKLKANAQIALDNSVQLSNS